jgi:hypothetical protein
MYLGAVVALLIPSDRMVRRIRDKEIDVKIPTFLLMVGAAILFAAPMANAREVIGEYSVAPHKVVKHVKTSKVAKHTKTSKSKTATAKTAAPRPPLYIYVPPFSGTPTVAEGTDWCATYMVDCTDQQLCDNWGLNCSTAANDQTAQGVAPVVAESQAIVLAASTPQQVFAGNDSTASSDLSAGSPNDGSTGDPDADC